MERVKENLRHIIRLAEETHMPGTQERIAGFARNALFIAEMGDKEKTRMGLALAALSKAIKHVPGGSAPDFEDLKLLNHIAREVEDLFPPEPQGA